MRVRRASAIDGLLQRLRNAAAQNRGSALIELAVVLALVGTPLLAGTIYTAELLFYDIEVSNAAHAGALYAIRGSTFASDSAGITSAAQAEASDLGSALSVTPVVFYACSSAIDGSQYTTQDAATAACTGGSNHALQFVQVSTSYAATPFASIAGMQRTVQLTSTSVMEVEE
jgi:hypothetical protein